MKQIGIIVVLALVLWVLGSQTSIFSPRENTQSIENESILLETENNTETTQTENMKALIKTNKGDIEITFANRAPKTVENFITLAEQDFYNGVKFHRVIKGFMIQGGDPLSKDEEMVDRWGIGGPGYSFDDEIHAGNSNVVGSISMANAGPNTNGSQFFINTGDNGFLNTKHTVFGNVTAGMDVVNIIEKVETFPNDRPVENVEILSIEIIKEKFSLINEGN